MFQERLFSKFTEFRRQKLNGIHFYLVTFQGVRQFSWNFLENTWENLLLSHILLVILKFQKELKSYHIMSLSYYI